MKYPLHVFARPFSSVATVLPVGLVAAGLLLTITGRASPHLPNVGGQLVQPDPNASGVSPAQPLAVQSLDPAHFVVVTREPRLVSKVGEEGRYMNMILYVVTHYTVQNGHLVPTEHVHVPQGYRLLGAGE
jgi:hypothetical protein